MVWDSTYQVGCGLAECPYIDVGNGAFYNALLFACNYYDAWVSVLFIQNWGWSTCIWLIKVTKSWRNKSPMPPFNSRGNFIGYNPYTTGEKCNDCYSLLRFYGGGYKCHVGRCGELKFDIPPADECIKTKAGMFPSQFSICHVWIVPSSCVWPWHWCWLQ